MAVAIALVTAAAASVEILAIEDLFTPALVLWALCLVLFVRAAVRRRRGPAVAYALGALPATVALAALVWVTT